MKVDYYTTGPFGRVVKGPVELVDTHPEGKCAGETCVIHKPSNHKMRDWKTCWRHDRGIVERLCPQCGRFVIDPDCLEFLAATGQFISEAYTLDCLCTPDHLK